MQPIPPNLLGSLPPDLAADASQWWDGLTDEARTELVELCDARKEIFLFETFSEDHADLVTGGKFLPHDDAFGIDEWGEDYFQHLLDHPELVIVYDAELRTFHIGCSRHPIARACLAKGEIAADFVCPFAQGDCRMRKILGQKAKVALRPLTVGH